MFRYVSARPWPLPSSPFAALWEGLQRRALIQVGEPPLVLGLVTIALVTHGLNMFYYPAFSRDDEGIYAAQAWAVLRLGQLSPYTYVYDHVPGGWLQLAAWMGLTGGPLAFGSAIDSGRVLMLLLNLAMVPLVYHLARKLGCGVPAAALGALLFSTSPLAIYFHRLLLLDTIMLFWVLVSLDLLLNGWGRLSRVALSGVCFALALLSKETAIFLLPAMLFIAVQDRRRHQGGFAVGGWLLPMLLVASWYPLYALLKGELFPSGQAAQFGVSGYGAAGVSLTDSLSWQASRSGGGIFNLDNDLWRRVGTDWWPLDPVLLLGGAAATLSNLVRGVWSRRALAAGLLGALPLAYLSRGGLVLDFYILLAIPFFCLNLAVFAAPLFARLPAWRGGLLGVLLATGLLAGYGQSGTWVPLFTHRETWVGREMVAWVKGHLPAESLIISRDDFWTDLREPGPGSSGFPNIHSHWKVAADPAIRTGVFQDDWRTVEYLITSRAIREEFVASSNAVALDALNNSHLLKSWGADDARVEIWKVDQSGSTERALLAGSAWHINSRFEERGAYADRDGVVTSEAQSYAMLRAVWMDDRERFDRAWRWTRDNLLDEGGLLAWLWRGGGVADPATAADADTDAALALLLASKRWQDPELLGAGRRMVQAIWERDVVVLNGVPYLTAGDWAPPGEVVALNPSYFAPYAYAIFQEIDPGHDWRGVIDSGYQVLFDASAAPLGAARSAGLPPDWVGLERDKGELVPLRFDQGDTTRYSYDAPRTYWRVALDRNWRGDGRASSYLKLAGFLRDEVVREGVPRAVYARDGAPLERGPSLVSTAGALAALLTLDPDQGHKLFAEQFVAGAKRVGKAVTWADSNDLYGQSWGWFATALYADALGDLWHAH